MDIYDLIILGGGPSGYTAAERAGGNGLRVLLIEKQSLGGVCLNEGCIPTKTLLHSAKIYDYAAHGKSFGIDISGASFNHSFVIERKNKIVKTLINGIAARMKKNNVTLVYGKGEITGRTDGLINIKADDNLYTAKNLLISTGSLPAIPPISGLREGLKSGFVLTSREILELNELPESLAVIGGGVIGLEMVSYFNSAGANVTVVEMLDKIAGPADSEISKILQTAYEKKGVIFKLNSKVTEIKDNELVIECGNQTLSIKADKILLAIGRKPVIEGYGLETIGVYIENGAIATDEFMRTNIPNVYATGDVNGKSMLAHTAYREAEVAVNNILNKKDFMKYNAIPSVIYTNPEVASIGETEHSAAEKGINFKLVKLPMVYSGRYMAESDQQDGICKILVDTDGDRVIGVHMIANSGSEIIYGAGMMIESEMNLDYIKKMIFPHPTVSEIIREAIFEF